MLPIERFKETLRRQRVALLRQVARAEDDLHWLDTNVEPELEEEGQEQSIAQVLARLDDRGKVEIDAIDRALARIATGDYGRCAECGRLIPEARLEALPTAELCVPCAESRERQET
jgi:RNA polymerase-binding protein DksA